MAARRRKKPTLALVNGGKGRVLRKKPRTRRTMSVTILPPFDPYGLHCIVETETRQPVRLKLAVVVEVEDDAIGAFDLPI